MRDYDYYYGDEAEQFSFYRIPKVLFTAESLKGISTDAKLLYGLMLDRMQLSARNRWIDEDGRVYIYFSGRQIMEAMGCASQKAFKLLDELEHDAALIERKRSGLNKPNRIYVKNFMSVVRLSNNQASDNHSSDSLKITLHDERNPNPNNTDMNNNEISNTEPINPSGKPRMSALDEYETYIEVIKDNIQYDRLIEEYPCEQDAIDEIVNLIVDTETSYSGTVRISGDDKPIAIVKSRFMKLDRSHIEYVIDGLRHNPTKVHNIRGYLLASLYNAPTTINNYYTALVSHDMATGRI